MSERFFGAKRPAAVLKHEILRRYLPIYVGKTGSTSKGRRVAYIDAYAGPGTYEDGSAGSPAVAVAIAEQVAANRAVDGYFIEREEDSAYALSDFIEREGLDWPVYNGEVEDELPTILRGIDAATSLFVFLDPFGLGVSMELIGSILERSGEVKWGYRVDGAATEVLLNFSFPGLRRNAGHLLSESDDPIYVGKTRETFVAKLDRTMGGDWWQDIWASGAEKRELEILRGYCERLGQLPGKFGWWAVPVANKWRGRPLYSLVQLSQHRDGRWEFHEALSNAMEPYREVCMDGHIDFEPLDEREAAWINEITANIRTILAEGKGFVIQDRMRAVFGTSLGVARTKHVRAAIKALYKAGETVTDGKGNVQRMFVKPAPQGTLEN